MEAFDDEFWSGDWKYSIREDGTVAIEEYRGEGGEIVVSEEIDGKTVTYIESFYYDGSDDAVKATISKIRLPATITGIRDRHGDGNYSISRQFFY